MRFAGHAPAQALDPAGRGRCRENGLAPRRRLTPDQQKRMDEAFEQSRLKLSISPCLSIRKKTCLILLWLAGERRSLYCGIFLLTALPIMAYGRYTGFQC
jgi:hypothetical protein